MGCPWLIQIHMDITEDMINIYNTQMTLNEDTWGVPWLIQTHMDIS